MISTLFTLLPLLPCLPPQIIGLAPPIIGPVVGNVTPTGASVWMRMDRLDQVHMSLVDGSGKIIRDQTISPVLAADKCLRWDLGGLEPDTSYAVTVIGERAFFKTAPNPDQATRVSIAFGSCADDRPGLPNPVWPAIEKCEPDALVLIGDTPYIDSTELEMQCRRYVEFMASKELNSLLRKTAFYATWDDHDFAKDGADGTTPGKENSRKAFVEHHVNPDAGEGNQGIYTRFRRGPVEVFLLDTRWFSGTEKSFGDPAKPTLLGAKQWAWLQKGLGESKATFKVLVSGMAWNDAVRPGKPDSWGAYPSERAALFQFIAEKSISGVVLVGGDLHRSRVLVHPPEETGVAYPIREFVTSPLGTNPMKEADVASPNLLFDKAEAHAFLLATFDSIQKPPVFKASFQSAGAGEFEKMEILADELRIHAAIQPVKRDDDGGIKRTDEVLALAKAGPADLVFLGDSITEGWKDAGEETWGKSYGKRKAVNLGVGGDRTQHVLWRIDHGQLDGLSPKLVVLMIGTNNSNEKDNTSREIGDGIAAVVARIRGKCPQAKVLLLAVFPRGEKPNPQREKNDEASHMAAEDVAKRWDAKDVRFLDIGPKFLGPGGTLSKEIMPDLLHLSPKGYAIWADAIEDAVKEMLGK
jgi:alkaline phosphatase D